MRTFRTPLIIVVATALAATGLATPATAPAAVTHTVARGETLTSIAAADGLSVSSLAAANGLSAQAELATGSRLVIPAQGALAAPGAATDEAAPVAQAESAPVAAASGGGDFVVPRGATLSAIAAEYGTSVPALAAANGLDPNGVLLAGTTISVPGAGSSPAAAPTAAPAVAPTTPAAASSVGAQPTADFVSPDTVGALAAQDGVSPSLAEAIADQESGFDNDEVSATGAVGVMQLEPQTWSDLTGPDGLQLSSESALDNVRGGVDWLHGLLAQTGGDEAEAIAAYYQGLRSVARYGMFPETRRYVRDVLALQERY